MPTANQYVRLAVSIIMCELTGIIGAFFTVPAIPSWYAGLNKPFFTPPDWIFAPVWILLYACMGIAFYLVWQQGGRLLKYRYAFYTFALQLGLNALWSYAFFGRRSPLLGMIVIVPLWAATIATMRHFREINVCAYRLLIPYGVWLSYALMLNTAIAVLNQ